MDKNCMRCTCCSKCTLPCMHLLSVQRTPGCFHGVGVVHLCRHNNTRGLLCYTSPIRWMVRKCQAYLNLHMWPASIPPEGLAIKVQPHSHVSAKNRSQVMRHWKLQTRKSQATQPRASTKCEHIERGHPFRQENASCRQQDTLCGQ